MHKHDRELQFWQEGAHAELLFSDEMMREKLDYIHVNPVRRGYVTLPEHWHYSSASNYAGLGCVPTPERGNDETFRLFTIVFRLI